MKRTRQEVDASLLQITLSEFLELYNKNTPASFPRASIVLLKKFQELHAALFKHGDLWSFDQHRKKLMDWLPRNGNVS